MYYFSTDAIAEDIDVKDAREQLDIDRLSEKDRQDYFRHIDNMRSLSSVVSTALAEGELKGY